MDRLVPLNLFFLLFIGVLIAVGVVVCLRGPTCTGNVRMVIVMIMTMIQAMTTNTNIMVKRAYLDATIDFVVQPEAATQTVRECVLRNPLRAAAFGFISPLCHDCTDVSYLK